jgi:hypothetical protein
VKSATAGRHALGTKLVGCVCTERTRHSRNTNRLSSVGRIETGVGGCFQSLFLQSAGPVPIYSSVFQAVGRVSFCFRQGTGVTSTNDKEADGGSDSCFLQPWFEPYRLSDSSCEFKSARQMFYEMYSLKVPLRVFVESTHPGSARAAGSVSIFIVLYGRKLVQSFGHGFRIRNLSPGFYFVVF